MLVSCSWLLQFLPTDNVDRVVGIVKNSLAISVRVHLFGGGGCAEFARMTCRHIFRGVIITLHSLIRLQMKGFLLKIDKRDIKRNMSSLTISIIS